MPRFPVTRTDAVLNGQPYVGQRSTTWRFDLVDAITGYRREIHPLISGQSGIRHDTQSTVKRTITGLFLDRDDTAAFNSITSRLEPFMIINGEEFQVGRYVPSDWARFPISSGTTSSTSFLDEMFIIDQQISNAFGALQPTGDIVSAMIERFLRQFPTITSHVESMLVPYQSAGSWSAGTRGGFIVDQLALDGDYLSPWFDNSSTLQFKRSFDASNMIPTFDYDSGSQVISGNIIESDNLINAPNRFVVIGNGSESFGGEVVGSADVASSAPHSITNRGFVVADVSNRQITSQGQASAIALNLARNQTLVEQVELSTLADPRHDSYDVVRWQGDNWMELSWNLPFNADGVMSHVLRKAYSP